MTILKIVFVIIGTLIGAGFASGQEVYTFFFSFGKKGLIGIFIASLVISLAIYKPFKTILKTNVKNYEDFLKLFIKNKKIYYVIDAIINIFILISFYIMIAGFGAYLQQEFNLNSILGSSILAILCVILFRKNVDGVIKLNTIIIPILITIIILIRNTKF